MFSNKTMENYNINNNDDEFSRIWNDLIEEICCPISGEIMKNPVMIKKTKYIYDKTSIENWYKKRLTCPCSNINLSHGDSELIEMVKMRNMIDHLNRLNPKLKDHRSNPIDIEKRLKELENKVKNKESEVETLCGDMVNIAEVLNINKKEINEKDEHILYLTKKLNEYEHNLQDLKIQLSIFQLQSNDEMYINNIKNINFELQNVKNKYEECQINLNQKTISLHELSAENIELKSTLNHLFRETHIQRRC